MLDDADRKFSLELSGSGHSLPTRVARVRDVLLLIPLIACEVYFIGIDNDDFVAAGYVGGKARFVLASNNGCHLAGQASQGLCIGINEYPFRLYGALIG